MSSAEGVLPVLAQAKVDQQPERVPVAGDGVRAGLALSDEPLGEERLQHRRERAHDSPVQCSSRAAASCISSGTADRYQLFRRRNNWYYSDSRVIPTPAPSRA